MKKLLSFLLLFVLSLTRMEAGFFSDLFEHTSDKKERQVQEVEEETISADDYYNNTDEPSFQEEKVFSNEPNENITEEENSYIQQKSIFLSYLQYPKKVYLNQHFTVAIKAVLTDENAQNITAKFVGGKDYTLLNPDETWKETDNKSYTIAYDFKLTSSKSRLPNIRVSSQNSSEVLKASPQKLVALKMDELFSNVLAKEFTLISHHEKEYDDKSNIVLLEVNATDSNLEDFHLPFAIREGIDSIKKRGNRQNIFYFAVLPKYQKELKFKYFNLNSNKFNRLSFPIMIRDTSVSTQTDLNPQKSKYFLYKVIGLISLALIFFVLYLKYKKSYLLFFALLIATYTIYTKLITNNLNLPKDIMIRILPTDNSTIFFKTAQKMQVEVLYKKNGYTKVLLPNTKIGWIKDADLSKN